MSFLIPLAEEQVCSAIRRFADSSVFMRDAESGKEHPGLLPFAHLTRADRRALAADAADVVRFLSAGR
jgi:hypothetical protein